MANAYECRWDCTESQRWNILMSTSAHDWSVKSGAQPYITQLFDSEHRFGFGSCSYTVVYQSFIRTYLSDHLKYASIRSSRVFSNISTCDAANNPDDVGAQFYREDVFIWWAYDATRRLLNHYVRNVNKKYPGGKIMYTDIHTRASNR